MKKPDIAKNEKERLEELDTYNIIGAEENDEYDFITSMAAQICDTKIALISLVTEDKQWFLSHHGLQARETSKDYSFCAHAINTPDQPFVIEDARIDERFFDNPLTTGDPHVIFYAGIPMVSENGLPLGSMCVIDDSPKKLSESQMNQLKKLSIQAVRLLELRRSNKKLLDLTNNINESSLISITDEKGTITEINKLFCELSGYTEAELVGQNHRIINSGYHDKQFWLDMWKTIAKGEIWRGEIKNRAKDGSEYWVASVITPVKDRSGKIRQYISIRQDITERKTIEIENEALTKRLNYALDASGDGIWDWTPANGQTVYSKAWLEMLGYEVGELTSLTSEWSDRLHPDDAEWVFAAINKVTQTAENGDTFSHEYRFRNKSDDYLWILNKAKVVERNEKGEASRVVGAHTNITERKEAEMLLQESEQRLGLSLEGGNLGLWDWDALTNKLIVNERWLSMLGLNPSTTKPTLDFWHSLVHPEDMPILQNLIDKVISNPNGKRVEAEVRAKHANGEYIWILDKGAIISRDNNGNPLRIVGTHMDITERKRAENQVRASAHYLNNIINSIPCNIRSN